MARSSGIGQKKKRTGPEAKRIISKTKFKVPSLPVAPRKGKEPASSACGKASSNNVGIDAMGSDGERHRQNSAAREHDGHGAGTSQSCLSWHNAEFKAQDTERERVRDSWAEQPGEQFDEWRLQESRAVERAESSKNSLCDCGGQRCEMHTPFCRIHHCYAEEVGTCGPHWFGPEVQIIRARTARYPPGPGWPTRRRLECTDCMCWASRDIHWDTASRSDKMRGGGVFHSGSRKARVTCYSQRPPTRISHAAEGACDGCAYAGCPLLCRAAHTIQGDTAEWDAHDEQDKKCSIGWPCL